MIKFFWLVCIVTHSVIVHSYEKESPLEILKKASKQYKEGTLSKNEYVETVLKISEMDETSKIEDKVFSVTSLIPFGSPNIDVLSDDQLKKLENKQIPQLREKFQALKDMQKNLGINELNLKCSSKNDCEAVPVGHKICGGPQSYLVVSKLDAYYNSFVSKINQFTNLDHEFQKMLMGFLGTCEYITPPKVSCESNVCKRVAN